MNIKLVQRHLSLKGFTYKQQSLINSSTIGIIGCGGLGCSAALYLSGAGIGKIIFIDGDTIEETNLHRQIAYTTFNIGKNKAEILSNRCCQTNINLKYEIHKIFLDNENINILDKADIILDCSDNTNTRILLNNYCKKEKKPLIFGSAISYDGQLCVFDFRNSNKCLFCVFPDIEKIKDTCDGLGVLGPVPGIIGNLQAIECIKLITGVGEVVKGLLHYSSYDTTFIEYDIEEKECTNTGIVDIEISYNEYIKNKNNYTLIDIRQINNQYDEEQYILGSIRINNTSVENILNLNKKNIVIICSIGQHSKEIVKQLRDKGKLDCWSIKNGFRGI